MKPVAMIFYFEGNYILKVDPQNSDTDVLDMLDGLFTQLLEKLPVETQREYLATLKPVSNGKQESL